MEGEARIDEDIRPARSGLQGPRRASAFQGADAGRADGDDPAAFGFGLVDGGSGFRRDAVEFTVHLMVFDIFFFYRPEGPQADVEGDEDFFYAFIANLLEQFFRKMQACRRRRSGAAFVGIDRLVFIRVFHLFVDIRRKRHFTDFVDDGVEIAFIGELDDAAAEIGPVFDSACQAFRKFDDRPGQGLLARFDQDFPAVVADGRQQQDFDFPTRRRPLAMEAGRDDAGIVEDQDVAFVQFVDEVIEILVFDGAGLAVIEHEAGVVPRFCRMLGNEFFR